MKKLLQSTRFWLIVFAAIILFSTAAMFFLKGGGSGTIAVITQDGKELQRIDLSHVTEPYTIRIDSDNGGYNIVEVEPGRIRVLEASCPDQICVNQGWISDSSKPIVCLPNKLMIVIEDGENPDGLDGISS
ncbi:MAG: NusG domain II-containing protein [Oscillospiraceae bacterium]